MKSVEKTKKQHQIKQLRKLEYRLKHKEKELKGVVKTFEKRTEDRTSAEKTVHKKFRKEIKQHKQVEQKIQNALNYANSIINTVREPLIVLDVNLKVISANKSFYQTFKVNPEETKGQLIYDLGNRQWNIPKLRHLLEKILPNNNIFENYEIEHNFETIGPKTMRLNAQRLDSAQKVLLAIEDVTERKKVEEKLETLASHDELTGCVNFRSTMELLGNEIARSKRYQKKFSMVMIDIDHFKRINDERGHQAGNNALVAFANVVKNGVRNIDIVGRYGGDEFVIVLPESDSQHASVVLERIRNNLNQTKIASSHLENAKEFTLQFSAGIVVFPYNAENLKELIWVADSALRQAKQERRNRTVLERRKLIRLNPTPGTRIEMVNSPGKENFKAFKIVNISKEGMLLLFAPDILDEKLLCRMYPPKGGLPFELTCKVKHKGKSENELYPVSVYFSDIPEDVKEKLSNCIESPKKSD